MSSNRDRQRSLPKPLVDWPPKRPLLYTFIDTDYVSPTSASEVGRALIAGGADLVQLRAKRQSEVTVRNLADELVPLFQTAKIPLVINDYPQIAQETGAPLFHLGQEDLLTEPASKFLLSDASNVSQPLPHFGVSTHAPDQALRALEFRPAYLGIGPVFATPTKPTAQAVTLDYVAWAESNVSIPWFAIGGVNSQNIDSILNAGAKGVCIVSAILTAPNIEVSCRRFRQMLA